MEPVFRLRKDRVGIGLEGFIINLLAAIGGQAVHDESVGLGELHEGLVDLITLQDFEARSGFGFLAHRNPHVGVKHIRAFGGGFQVFGADDVATSALQDSGLGLEFFWRGDAEFKAEFGRGKNPRDRHVARAVADERDDQTFQCLARFQNGLEVGKNLAGMFGVRERVDGRDV